VVDKLESIRIVALCVFKKDDKILVRKYDGDFTCFRPIGGTVEYGEHSEQAVVREVREEIGIEISDPRLLGIIENVFVPKDTGEGLGHNIEFIYEAEMPDVLNNCDEINGIEGKEGFQAVWMPVSYFQESKGSALIPDGLLELLTQNKTVTKHVASRT
jgi:8-oxo-dGTP pyrophosphatase MutT (NUDIX family)